MEPAPPILAVDGLSFAFGPRRALEDVTMSFTAQCVTAVIGPSGCGKTTLLRCLNRLNDLVPEAHRLAGDVHFNGESIYDPACDVQALRRRIGMIIQQANPFPFSIYDNVAYGLRLQGESDADTLDEAVAGNLKRVGLWEELRDQLHEDATALPPGQQQRMCIARALAVDPEVLLMDEPCALLDPVATAKVEELLHELKRAYTIVIVTHNLQQAARVSDQTAFFYQGRLVEVGETESIFVNPGNHQTEAYISGRFG